LFRQLLWTFLAELLEEEEPLKLKDIVGEREVELISEGAAELRLFPAWDNGGGGVWEGDGWDPFFFFLYIL
jgi:hypothetical protein